MAFQKSVLLPGLCGGLQLEHIRYSEGITAVKGKEAANEEELWQEEEDERVTRTFILIGNNCPEIA